MTQFCGKYTSTMDHVGLVRDVPLQSHCCHRRRMGAMRIALIVLLVGSLGSTSGEHQVFFSYSVIYPEVDRIWMTVIFTHHLVWNVNIFEHYRFESRITV